MKRETTKIPHARHATQLPAGAICTPALVDDPYEPGNRISVLASVRDDPLRDLRARGQLEEHQFAAGRHWQRLWEQAEVGSVRAIDPTRLQVDGSAPVPEVVALRRRHAIGELSRARKCLGHSGNALVSRVLAQGWTLRMVAVACNLDARSGSRDRLYLGARFRECLDDLAVVFGYA